MHLPCHLFKPGPTFDLTQLKVFLTRSNPYGGAENAGTENEGPIMSSLRDQNAVLENAGPENAGVENA